MGSIGIGRHRSIWLAAALVPMLVLVAGAKLANGASGPTAQASGTCSVFANDPFRSGNKLVASGRSVCTNDAIPGNVRTLVIKACLQRLDNGSWGDRKCERQVRHAPGKVVARASKVCPQDDTQHRYRVFVSGSIRSTTGFHGAATAHSVPPPDGIFSRLC